MSFTSSSSVNVTYRVNPKDVSTGNTSNAGYTVRTYNTTTGTIVPSIGGTPTPATYNYVDTNGDGTADSYVLASPGSVTFYVDLSEYGSYIIDVIKDSKVISTVSITRIDNTSVLYC